MPYTYDEYLNSFNTAQAPRGRSNTMSTLPGGVGPGQNRYDPGMSNREYVRENLGVGGNQFSAENMAHGLLNPVGGVIEGVRGYGHFKKSQKQYKMQQARWKADLKQGRAAAGTNWLRTIDPTSRTAQAADRRLAGGDPMSDDELNLLLRQEDQGKQRAGYEADVEAYFSDPARAGWQRGIVQNRLQNDLANVQEDYGNELTSSGQQTAGQGLKGGSVDVENRGAVARTRDTRAIQAGSDAESALADFGARDRSERANLLGLVNSGDIGSADALRGALDSIHSSSAAEGARYAGQQRQRQISQFGDQQQSQAWGGGLSALAGSINQNPSGYSWLSRSNTGGW